MDSNTILDSNSRLPQLTVTSTNHTSPDSGAQKRVGNRHQLTEIPKIPFFKSTLEQFIQSEPWPLKEKMETYSMNGQKITNFSFLGMEVSGPFIRGKISIWFIFFSLHFSSVFLTTGKESVFLYATRILYSGSLFFSVFIREIIVNASFFLTPFNCRNTRNIVLLTVLGIII